jgi:hypothetical protein
MSLWGELNCPKCNNNLWNPNLQFMLLDISQVSVLKLVLFNSPRVRSLNRIGPHNIDILSIIFGAMLGDGYCEKHGNGARICFQQEGSHSHYLLWLHNYVSQLGYCSQTSPKLLTRLASHGKLRKVLRFNTFTFSSFNWIEESFYRKDVAKSINGSANLLAGNRVKKKILPYCIEEFLSPLALAIWIMDDGGKVSSGIKISTNNFHRNEVLLLCYILMKKFDIYATIQSAGLKKKDYIDEANPVPCGLPNVNRAEARQNNINFNKYLHNNLETKAGLVTGNDESRLSKGNEDQYILYISKSSMLRLAYIVGPYIHPSMKYKLNGYL